MDLSENAWDNRYLNNDIAWDLGEVSPPLKAYFDQLTNKEIKILIPGGGNSYEAAYLFEKGFENDSNNEAKQCNFQAIYEDYRGWANGNNFEESYLYIVDNNGNCIDGRASSQNVALKECQRRKAKKLIKNSECKVYAIGDEIVWDGSVWDDSVKASKSASKEVSTLETNASVDYVERLKQIKALLDSGIINQDDFEKMKQKIIDTMN